MKRGLLVPIVAALSFGAVEARAQNFEILDQKLDASREGYTVVRVWGDKREIGQAIGVAFAGDIVGACADLRAYAGTGYDSLRTAMGMAAWLPSGVDEQFEGLAEGVRSVHPSANIDAVDMKVLNTYGDWAYACRSHSCWGSRAQAPYTTISTRRLDFGSPFAAVHHHVLYAVQPADEPVRWVNLAWPGFISVVTGVNEHGTLASVHDFNSNVAAQPGVVSRAMAVRHLLTSVPSGPVSSHLGWATQQLSTHPIATGTFLNYYVPQGLGGVFTCAAGQTCTGPRVPQSDYLGGEVLITTNSQTTGHSTPEGASFLDPYYQQPGAKSPESHFDVMVDQELHMLTVGVRGPGDMRLLAHGRTKSGWTPRIDVEWTALFPANVPDAGVEDGALPDAAQPDVVEPDVVKPDAAGPDGGEEPDAAGPVEAAVNPDGSAGLGGSAGAGGSASSDDGCGCSTPGRGVQSGWWVAVVALVLVRSRRRLRVSP